MAKRIVFDDSKNITIANLFDDWFVMINNQNPNIPTITYHDKHYISILDAINPTPVKWCVWFNKQKRCYILRLYYLGFINNNKAAMLLYNYNVIRFKATNTIDIDGSVNSNYIAVDIKVCVDIINDITPRVADEPAF